jgi:hypothetical protein
MEFKQPPRRNFNSGIPNRAPQTDPNLTENPIAEEPPKPALTPVNDAPDPENPDTPKEDFHITPSPEHRSKKKKILIILAVLLVLLLAAGAVYWFFFKPKPVKQTNNAPVAVVVKKETPKAKPTSPLTGVEVATEELAARPVTGVMIENSPDARPQSGLTDAGVVYEAIAEGGITRFLAVYQESQANYIGPVRSARPYYLDFIAPYDAGYAHVGGSPQALSDIKTLGIKDLDQFYNGDYYVRVSDRYAPHNVYTGFDKLDKLNKSKGYTSSKFTGFVRKPDVAQTPTAKTIDFSISSPLYSPRYEYDASSNTYKRFQDGEPHIDQKTKAQIAPKVVIALVMDKNYDPDGYHTDYKTVGSGKMYVFQDGIVSEGTWQKSDRKTQFVFTDKNGLPMKLNAGQTWISLVANQSDVSYKP